MDLKAERCISTRGLVLVAGHSRDEIRQALTSSGFMFTWGDSLRGAYYFRETGIGARGPYEKVYSSLIRKFGEPTSKRVVRGWGKRPVAAYHALWEMTEEFDKTVLDGPITFKDGKLVERTFFHFPKD